MFNGVCVNILDAVAPFKLNKPRSCVHPWLNDETGLLDRNGEKQKGSCPATEQRRECAHHTSYIYMYAFSRRFYPKQLTVHSGYTFIVSMCVPWKLNPRPLRC